MEEKQAKIIISKSKNDINSQECADGKIKKEKLLNAERLLKLMLANHRPG